MGLGGVDIPLAIAADLQRVAAEGFPEEVCGLLIGARLDGEGIEPVNGQWRVDRILPIANGYSGTPQGLRAFAMDEHALVNAYRACRHLGLEIIGHYHSHPNGLARPSATDAEMVTDPCAVWLIVAITGGRIETLPFRCLSAWLPQTDVEGGFAPLLLGRDLSSDD